MRHQVHNYLSSLLESWNVTEKYRKAMWPCLHKTRNKCTFWQIDMYILELLPKQKTFPRHEGILNFSGNWWKSMRNQARMLQNKLKMNKIVLYMYVARCQIFRNSWKILHIFMPVYMWPSTTNEPFCRSWGVLRL